MTINDSFPEIKDFSARTAIDTPGGVMQFFPKVLIAGKDREIRIRPPVDDKTNADDVTSNSMGDPDEFDEWLKPRRKIFLRLATRIRDDFEDTGKLVTIYGTFAGPTASGQCGGVASQIKEDTFFITGIRIVTDDEDVILHNSEILAEYMPKPQPDNIKVVPFLSGVEIDFSDAGEVEDAEIMIQSVVDEILKLDPYFKDEYDIEGEGRGLMFWPGSPYCCDTKAVEQFAFFA